MSTMGTTTCVVIADRATVDAAEDYLSYTGRGQHEFSFEAVVGPQIAASEQVVTMMARMQRMDETTLVLSACADGQATHAALFETLSERYPDAQVVGLAEVSGTGIEIGELWKAGELQATLTNPGEMLCSADKVTCDATMFRAVANVLAEAADSPAYRNFS